LVTDILQCGRTGLETGLNPETVRHGGSLRRCTLAVYAAIVLGGVTIALLASYPIARALEIKNGRSALASYANQRYDRIDALARESEHIQYAVFDAKLPFCSDAEIGFMRDLLYKATYVRGIERTRADRVYCMASRGKLPKAVPLPTLNFSVSLPASDPLSPGVLHVYMNALSPMSQTERSVITEGAHVATLVNPDSFQDLEDSRRTYSGFLFDPLTSKVMREFGHVIPLSDAQVINGQLIQQNGTFYQPKCSRMQPSFCVVAAETENSLLSRGHELFWGCLFCGASIGGCTALILIFAYRKHCTLETQLRRAIERKNLKLLYQPIRDLDTKAIVGAEALVCWTKENGEIVGPDTFVALAEEKGFVGEITQFVIHRAVAELDDLLRSNGFRLTINITSTDLMDPAFLPGLENCLRVANVNSSSIGLEFTERSTVDSNVLVDAIHQLNQAGHQVYVDDFGTGYSNLAYLHRLDVAAIKIDRIFTQTVSGTAIRDSIVPEILEMASKLQLSVVVEGIETEDQAEYFRNARGGILGQGWLFGRPMSAIDLRHQIDLSRESSQVTESDQKLVLSRGPLSQSMNRKPKFIVKLDVSMIDWSLEDE
jgi:sensor c-di-GMP phosphodiesterase-like protein